MHELCVIQGVVEACGERAGDTRVLRVTLEVGTLSCVMPRWCCTIISSSLEATASK